MPLAEVNADPGAGSDAHADWVATCHAFAAALDRGGMEAFADMAVASPLFGSYCSKGPAAQRFLCSCLMTHRAHGIAHTALHRSSVEPRVARRLQRHRAALPGEGGMMAGHLWR